MMKPNAILSEAWRNIATGTTRALACAVVLTLIAAGTAILDLTGILSLQHESRQWATSAADIHIISGSKQIDPTPARTSPEPPAPQPTEPPPTPSKRPGHSKTAGKSP